jgi:hypothetical protein
MVQMWQQAQLLQTMQTQMLWLAQRSAEQQRVGNPDPPMGGGPRG